MTETTNTENGNAVGGRMQALVMWLLNLVWPMCPSWLPHRVRGPVVTNANGHEYCWHRDCFKANDKDLRLDATRCPNCFDKIVGEDDDAGVCISCGGRNRKLKWTR